ncbi:MAG TPA: alpha-L-rhamnosidase C-terminal domain-containing protein, partial [bacterium]|nr:alpha-L-rhamnosidase C-terminal domain-containing protein [bacterium]
LLPKSVQPLTVRLLLKDIEERDGHLSTGFVGLPILLKTLTKFGHADVAYKLLLNDTFPSWGYEIKHGATTIWERWDGWTQEKGFQDPGMNSFNHYAFGAVGEWLFATVAGIDLEEPGFKKIHIRPCPDGRISSVKATYRSINGEIVSEWRQTQDKFALSVTIPPNTEAAVSIPAASPSHVRENGIVLEESEGVHSVEAGDGVVIVRVGSGRYRFVSKRKRSQ